MTPPRGAVLLTGATGFVGDGAARPLSRAQRPRCVHARARARRRGRTRAHRRGAGQPVRLPRGQALRRPRAPGRRRAHRARAWDSTSAAPRSWPARSPTVVHSAASVSFTLPLEEAREINLEGTRRMVEFAQMAQDCGGLERYGHVSTAYVAGTYDGRFAERDLDVGQEFNNSYEQSKFEAEQLVRSHRTCRRRSCAPASSSATVAAAGRRRSTSCTGRCGRLRGACSRPSPRSPSAPVDVVSVDYVADGIYEIVEHSGGIGETYHLTAGVQASTIAEISQLASHYFSRPAPRVLDAGRVRGRGERVQRRNGDRGRPRLLPVLLDQDRVRRRRHTRAPGAGRDQGVAARRLHGPAAGLRHA